MQAQPMTKDLIAQHNLTDDELTEDEEVGILESLAELDAGRGVLLANAIETIKGSVRRP